ncbi:MAG: hypothetical protein SCK29_02900 [Bacillota bacterium]|nr:hypothetical protein [Bacillota bacterium]MDW7683051.1 hypothetical protein [Bacillota bacterium]
MNWIAAGVIAAFAAFFTNRLTYRVWEDTALLGPVPLAEEVIKTMLAYSLGAGIFLTHLVFGIMEAILDWRGQSRGLPAAASAVIAHSIFGLVTVVVSQKAGMLGAGIAISFLVHALWNAVMLFRTVKR